MPASPRAPSAGARPAPPGWLVWTALGIIYVVWGSTYLGIRVMVETIPPFLGAGVRFLAAGLVFYALLRLRKGRAAVRFAPRQLGAAAVAGSLLIFGGNGLVTVAEQDVPSGLAALIIASVPLWVVVLRALTGERIAGVPLVGVAIGFAGVALLVLPGERPDGATLSGILLLVLAAASWATGSVYSQKGAPLPRDAFLSTALQMICGGGVMVVIALASGEAGELALAEISADSLIAFGYLLAIGSLVAFTAYVWLLQHVPVSKVATYAYVNPVIAVFLGWLVLSEQVSALMIAGTAVIVASVWLVVRTTSAPAVPAEDPRALPARRADAPCPEGRPGAASGTVRAVGPGVRPR